MTMVQEKPTCVRCLDNQGYEVSLELSRVYRCQADPVAAAHGLVRVIDETGEGYLYPREMFEPATETDSARLSRRRRH